MIKYLVVMEFELDGPTELAKTLKAIDPPSIPGFRGPLRVAIDPVATQVEGGWTKMMTANIHGSW